MLPRKLLVIRNDKLGDFMLSLPAFALLQRALPQTAIHALLPDYTRELALASGLIDHVIRDPGPQADPSERRELMASLVQQGYDAALTLFSTTRTGWYLWRAGIPYRLAPATKLAQMFYNHRVRQRRSQSAKPEYDYNLDLGKRLLLDFNIEPSFEPRPPYLNFAPSEIVQLRQTFTQRHSLATNSRLVFIHPGSGGSAVNLSLAQYAELALAMQQETACTFIISAGPGELEHAQILAHRLVDIPHMVYHSDQGLVMFAQHIAFADLFISGSTGPLHIAGALNRPTVGFYPRRRSATALRWQTLSQENRRLSFSPPAESRQESMSDIDVTSCAKKIAKFLIGLQPGA